MLGLPVGLALSFFVSGAVAQRHGWQTAFFVAGVPGLVLAVLVLWILDPPRGGGDSSAVKKPGGPLSAEDLEELEESYGKQESVTAPRSPPASFAQVARRVLAMPTMWLIIVSGALHNFNMYALGSFLASFLRRYHGVTIEQAGLVSGLVYGVGAVGLFAAGWLGDRAFRRGPGGRLHVAWVGLALAVPCLLGGLAAPPGRLWLCVAGLLPGCLLLYAYYGTVYATIQDIVEPASRGMAMAIYFCAMYLLGGVLGPVGTGWLSDHFAGRAAVVDGADGISEWHKAVGLNHAMYIIPILNAALVVVLFAASQTVRRDYQRANPSKEV
jgi:MFS family permease